MARKKKVGRPPGRAKPKLLSVRVTKEMWDLLRQAAWENRHSLSREVEVRLDYTFGRRRKGDKGYYELPLHLRSLADAFTFTARYIERHSGADGTKTSSRAGSWLERSAPSWPSFHLT